MFFPVQLKDMIEDLKWIEAWKVWIILAPNILQVSTRELINV